MGRNGAIVMPSVGTVSWWTSNSKVRREPGDSNPRQQVVAARRDRLPRAGNALCRETSLPGSRSAAFRGPRDRPAAAPSGLTLGIATRSASRRVRSSTDQPRPLSLDPFQVLAGAGVDPDLLARLDERRDLDLQARSRVASLYWLVAVAPASAGGVSVTASSTESGISIETGLSLMYLTITFVFGSRYCIAVPMMSGEK